MRIPSPATGTLHQWSSHAPFLFVRCVFRGVGLEPPLRRRSSLFSLPSRLPPICPSFTTSLRLSLQSLRLSPLAHGRCFSAHTQLYIKFVTWKRVPLRTVVEHATLFLRTCAVQCLAVNCSAIGVPRSVYVASIVGGVAVRIGIDIDFVLFSIAERFGYGPRLRSCIGSNGDVFYGPRSLWVCTRLPRAKSVRSRSRQ